MRLHFFVDLVGAEQLLESLDQLRFLVFNLSLEGVAWEIDVLPLLPILRSVGGVVGRVEWLLLVELIESAAVVVALYVRLERRLGVPQSLPVDVPEERVVLDLLDTVLSKSIVVVAHESL